MAAGSAPLHFVTAVLCIGMKWGAQTIRGCLKRLNLRASDIVSRSTVVSNADAIAPVGVANCRCGARLAARERWRRAATLQPRAVSRDVHVNADGAELKKSEAPPHSPLFEQQQRHSSDPPSRPSKQWKCAPPSLCAASTIRTPCTPTAPSTRAIPPIESASAGNRSCRGAGNARGHPPACWRS